MARPQRNVFANRRARRVRDAEHHVQCQTLMTPSRATKHKPTISLLSDQTLFREGVSELLNRRGYHRVAQFQHRFELLAAAAERAPDIVIVDLDHESEDTMTLMHGLRRDLPDAHLIVMGTAVRRAAADAASTSAVETPVGGSASALRSPRPRAPCSSVVLLAGDVQR